MVIGDDDTDHADGISSTIDVPSPGFDSIASRPPRSAARSTSSASPKWPSSRRPEAAAASKPAPSSLISATTVPFRRSRLTVTWEAFAWSATFRSASCAGTEDQLLGLGREASDPVRRELGLDAAAPQRREEVRDRGLEPRVVEIRRVDLDEEGAELPHRFARDSRRGAKKVAQLRSRSRLRLPGRDVEAVRDARQVLDGAVVKVGGDSAALDVRRLDRVHEELLALTLTCAQPPLQPGRERDLNDPERRERDDEGEQERKPDPPARRRDRAVADVRLEQEGLPAGRVHREVDLEELVKRLFESVFRSVEVADLGVDLVTRERGEVLRAERVARADQSVLVGVDDLPVRRPELYADHRVDDHAFPHEPIQARNRSRIAAHEAVREGGLDRRGAEDARQPPRVPHRLGVPLVPEDEVGSDPDQHQGKQARDGELQHGARNHRWMVRSDRAASSPGSAVPAKTATDIHPKGAHPCPQSHRC